jgi:hypothetical protein
MPTDRRRTRRVVVYVAELPHTDPVEYYRVEYEAIADALHFACRDLREGRRRPVEIREDGVLVYDAEGLAAACREREAQSRSKEETE